MDGFAYTVVSSILHDRNAVERIFSSFEPLLSGLGGSRIEMDKGVPAIPPPFFFILTGGTEGSVLEYLSRLPHPPSGKPFPLVLLAHTHHNSLPAALEIAARARQDGGSALVIQIHSIDDAMARDEILEAAGLMHAIASMRESRIGAVGEASNWLVASSQSAAAISSSWGSRLESIPIDDLKKAIVALRKPGQDSKDGDSGTLGEQSSLFIKHACCTKEPALEDVRKSDIVYRALKNIVAERKLDALTLRCFDILGFDGSTGCFALSQLADEGIDAGCEGDIPSILGLRWMRLLSGKPGWMANPSEIWTGQEGGKGKVLLAHCTVPRSLLTKYGIRSHFESGLGVAVAGSFAPGPVTLLRIGGVGLDKAWLAEGFLTECPSDEGLCRTQAIIEMENADLEKLLESPLGNHLVMGVGHWGKLARRYLALEDIAEV
ncbi:MAG: hypothetical protein CVV53_06480 [Spirochaetae bacterium HGW-Spirochaetae-9]|nr:MAG: hypothetical protein CVV53_06480 [Spirochaetae bacterium HGW-Spirochaetae-9]